jgi:ABC-2 type transport system permease protein
MTGTLTLTRLEVRRVLRNKRYLGFTIGLPVVLYLAFGRSQSLAYGLAFKEFYMIAMASIGAFSGALTGNAQRISQERKDGWIRQLRISSLPASGYVIAKIVASMVTSVTSVVLVLLLGRFYGDVHMPLWKWMAVGVAIWIGAMTFAALAVATDVIGQGTISMGRVGIILAWLAGFVALAAISVRSTAEKI